MRLYSMAATAAALSCALTAGAAAQQSASKKSLQSQAKISQDSARVIALAKVPNGKVKGEELEREHGTVIYSYDIAVPGKSGITEVNVSAIDGHVVAVQHESAADERKEAAAEKHAKKDTTSH
jgi:uncharacterized membrane protein YkoI